MSEGPFCDGETCENAILIGELFFDGEKWFEYTCYDCSYYFMKRVREPQKMHFKLFEHQLEAIERLGNGKVLWGGVGTGKSLTALGYYVKNEAPKDLYVITTAKKRDSFDWVADGAKFGIGTTVDSTVSGVLHVDSWQNIKKYVDVEDAFFIFDEQRLVGTGAWYKAFIKITKKNNWILLSATPGDTWLDYIALFVANGFYKNLTEFKDEHVIYNAFTTHPKVEGYKKEGKLIRQRNQILVHMPYQKHTKRHLHIVDVPYDSATFDRVLKDRWHVYEDRPIQNIAEMFLTLRKVVNSDPSRLEHVKCLMQKHPKLIIFYNFNYELEMLRTLAHDSGSVLMLPSELGLRRNNEKEKFHIETSFESDQSIGDSLPMNGTPHTEQTRPHVSTESSDRERESSFAPAAASRLTRNGSLASTTLTRSNGSGFEGSERTDKPWLIEPSEGWPQTHSQGDLNLSSSSSQKNSTKNSSQISGASASNPWSPQVLRLFPNLRSTTTSTQLEERTGTTISSEDLTEQSTTRAVPVKQTVEHTGVNLSLQPHSSSSTDTQLSTIIGMDRTQSRKRTLQGASVRDVKPETISQHGYMTAQRNREERSSLLESGTGVQIAEWNGHKHEEIPSSDRWVYLVQYTAGSEGWNCVETDAMVLFSLTYSYKSFHQALGRIDRLNTQFRDLHYYVLKSNSMIDDAVWKSLRAKKSFNESTFSEQNGLQNG